jgi:hypothetical protein
MADSVNDKQWSEQRSRAGKAPAFTDAKGKTVFDLISARVLNAETANQEYEKCDTKRLGSGLEQHETAYTYLALGFKMAADSTIVISSVGNPLSAAQMFHFAGHAFREIGQINRAADAYWRAGVIGEQITELAVRSLARAKSTYSEIGEANKSDEMHRLEWDARRVQSHGSAWFLLSLWKITSSYGTCSRRWFLSVVAFILIFTVSYESLHRVGDIADTQKWTPWLTAAYMAVVTTGTVGYGDVLPVGPLAQIVVILNITTAYSLLAIGSTILGRKVLAR